MLALLMLNENESRPPGLELQDKPYTACLPCHGVRPIGLPCNIEQQPQLQDRPLCTRGLLHELYCVFRYLASII